MDSASFAHSKQSLPALKAAFVQKVGAAIARCCANRLSQAEAAMCLQEAAEHSGWGRFAFANNYWMLPGVGDAGSFLLARVRRRYDVASGYEPQVLRYAKFSSIDSALDAWCKAHGR